MSDPMGHILGYYFADVLIETGTDCLDGSALQVENGNYLNAKNTAYSRMPRSSGASYCSGCDMIDGDIEVDGEEEESDQIKKEWEEVAKMLGKIGDNVNEQYQLPEFNPSTNFESQMEDILAGRLDQSEVQQIALVLRFAKDVVRTASNKESILASTRHFISGRFAGWFRQYAAQ